MSLVPLLLRHGRTGALSAVSTAVAVILSVILPLPLSAQCPYTLSNGLIANNGQLGVAFELTAAQSTQLCRIKTVNFSGTQTLNVQVWAHPNGFPWPKVSSPAGVNDGLWFKVGEAPVTFTGPGNYTEIPVDLGVLGIMNPGQKWGFCLFSNGTIGYKTGVAPYVFSDAYLRMDTQCWGVSGSTGPGNATAFSFGFYPRQFCGQVVYKEGCFIPEGAITLDVTDVSGNPLPYANLPGTVYARYAVSYPAGPSTTTFTLNFYRVGDPSPVPSHTASFQVAKPDGQNATGFSPITLPASLSTGYYRITTTVSAINSCGGYSTLELEEAVIMLLPAGQQPCLVWPGDLNNDGVVNYGDRSSLNRYIQQANLSPLWLTGPARYRSDAAANPLTYLAWEAQPAVPWHTANGCYMDADGNGTVNSFDYLGVRMNWLRMRGALPRTAGTVDPNTFDMSQNYPNPFSTSTTSIAFSIPQRSQVRLVVTDMLGREVARLVDGTVGSGLHKAVFDATGLNSGQYIATITMTGESGLTFTKSVKMTLTK